MANLQFGTSPNISSSSAFLGQCTRTIILLAVAGSIPTPAPVSFAKALTSPLGEGFFIWPYRTLVKLTGPCNGESTFPFH
jgi:hypothetical protein